MRMLIGKVDERIGNGQMGVNCGEELGVGTISGAEKGRHTGVEIRYARGYVRTDSSV